MYIYLIIGIGVLLLMKTIKAKTINSTTEINLSEYNITKDYGLTDKQKKEYIFIRSFVYSLLSRNDALGTPLPFDLICAIVYQESYAQILQNMPNNLIEGYDGKSIGYFQVTKWAVAELNKRENYSYTYNDCYSENINVQVGLSYLFYCYNSANNDIYLTGKKYNGGLDETKTSQNSMASVYADKIVRRYNIFKSISEK